MQCTTFETTLLKNSAMLSNVKSGPQNAFSNPFIQFFSKIQPFMSTKSNYTEKNLHSEHPKAQIRNKCPINFNFE